MRIYEEKGRILSKNSVEKFETIGDPPVTGSAPWMNHAGKINGNNKWESQLVLC